MVAVSSIVHIEIKNSSFLFSFSRKYRNIQNQYVPGCKDGKNLINVVDINVINFLLKSLSIHNK